MKEYWNIGIIPQPIETMLTGVRAADIRWFPPPPSPHLFRADPFGVVRNGQLHIFFELFDYRIGRGVIAVALLDESLHLLEEQVVLDNGSHMSYPYLFEYKGELYMIPETYQAREVAIYKNRTFPYEWEKISSLLTDVHAFDSTLWYQGPYWWLTCTQGIADMNRKLHLYYAESPWGPWRSHHANPVISNLGSARPAGTIFCHEDSIYRPAQDCSTTYGGAITIHRIAALTPDIFKEVLVQRILPPPGPYPDGIHTLSQIGSITLIDGKIHTKHA